MKNARGSDVCGSGSFGGGFRGKSLERWVKQPQPGAALALQRRDGAPGAAGERVSRSAGGAKQFRGLAGDHFRANRLAAEVAEPRVAADARETMRANGIEIAFVEREIGAAVFARQCPFVPRSAAMGAADHGGIVPTRFVDREHFAAVATKLLANGKLRGIVLAIAMRAGDEEASHGKPLLRRIERGLLWIFRGVLPRVFRLLFYNLAE